MYIWSEIQDLQVHTRLDMNAKIQMGGLNDKAT